MKKYLIILFLFFLAPQAHAAVARDTYTLFAHVNTTNFSGSFTINTTGEGLIVEIADNSSNGGDRLSEPVQWNGATMTRVAFVNTGCTNNGPLYMYKLSNATVGTGNITFAMSPSTNVGVTATSYTGVDTTDIVDAVTSACDNNAPTPSLNANQAGDWYLNGINIWNAWPSAVAGATCLDGVNNCTASPATWSSEASVGGSGSHSFAYTSAAGSDISHIDILLKPSTGVAATVQALYQRVLSWF